MEISEKRKSKALAGSSISHLTIAKQRDRDKDVWKK